MLRPIPESINASDLSWEAEFRSLERDLCLAKLRPTVISRWTGVAHRHVLRTYQAVHGTSAASGPVQYGTPERFVNDRGSQRRSGFAVNVQAAVFLHCFLSLSDAMGAAMNVVWLLNTAYKSYLRISRSAARAAGVAQLDINSCFAILHHAGILGGEQSIALARCQHCKAAHLVLTKPAKRAVQGCPICEMNRIHRQAVVHCTKMRGNRTGAKSEQAATPR